jgi:hypothetical protein
MRDAIGECYLRLALHYGFIELLPGHKLYSGEGVKQ